MGETLNAGDSGISSCQMCPLIHIYQHFHSFQDCRITSEGFQSNVKQISCKFLFKCHSKDNVKLKNQAEYLFFLTSINMS